MSGDEAGADSTTDDASVDSTGTDKLDVGMAGTGGGLNCAGDQGCSLIDLVFIIDNSGTMGEEQLNLAQNFQPLVEKLQSLTDADGNPVNPDVNIMVTTSDFGHPLCTNFQKPDYTPRQGAPVYEGCNARINRFTGLDPDDPLVIEEACQDSCPVDIAPGQHFIHFDSLGSNVPADDIGAALSCIGPQGIDGCGYEAPLETMLQAINEDACWNNPGQERCDNEPEWAETTLPFLREDAVLAIAIITDEMDCSVKAPNGYSWFTDPMETTHWNINPALEIAQATSAVCWNSGIECVDADDDGVYENCASKQNDVLHDVDRYISYLKYLTEDRGKEVVMLGIVGIPEVTAHNEEAPFEPTEGGVLALTYRDWIDGEYDGTPGGGDILPDEWMDGMGTNAEQKRFEFGAIGPGCTGQDGNGNFTGQAIPPVRIREVCESLDRTDENGETVVRCCMESICDTDYSDAINCLTGIVQKVITPG
ncbi:MAG: hypothetical protein JKY37_04910 [Nannocystaceae bacterium]|nr:hypothetical protein [Nannocystaceae bacterium]